jgi:hypothetical protein
VLEREVFPGRYIPIIEIIGKEYFSKGKRRWKGVIANAQDMLRAINVILSAATELAGQMPRSPYVMYEGQDEDYEDEWDDLWFANQTRLHIKAVLDEKGVPLPPPQRQQQEVQIQGLMLLLRMMHEMYHAVTGSVAPQLRAVNPYDRSGKAIEALQRQGAAGTSNYLDNMATISMPYEGKVLLSAIPQVYDKPGRILRVNTEESDDEIAIMIRRPFVRDADGNPVAIPCPTCKGLGVRRGPLARIMRRGSTVCDACKGSGFATKETMPEEYQGQTPEYIDFSDGEFKVVPVLDRSFETKQTEALMGMEGLAKAAPQLVPAYAAEWVEAMGFSGSNKVAEKIRAMFPSPGDDDPTLRGLPPAVMARFTQLQQRHQAAMQALQQATQMLQTDAVKGGDAERTRRHQGRARSRA